jgi:hypothetical protein
VRGGLALDRAARYISADFPTSGADGRATSERGALMARQFLVTSANPSEHRIFLPITV